MEWRVFVVAHEYGSVVVEAGSREEAIEAAKEADMYGDVSYHTREVDVADIEVESYDEDEEE